MAFSFTVSGAEAVGRHKRVWGTFTSADGDSTMTLSASTHGLNNIIDDDIRIDGGGLGTQTPKVTISAGTITAVWDDTLGKSGTFSVLGN